MIKVVILFFLSLLPNFCINAVILPATSDTTTQSTSTGVIVPKEQETTKLPTLLPQVSLSDDYKAGIAALITANRYTNMRYYDAALKSFIAAFSSFVKAYTNPQYGMELTTAGTLNYPLITFTSFTAAFLKYVNSFEIQILQAIAAKADISSLLSQVNSIATTYLPTLKSSADTFVNNEGQQYYTAFIDSYNKILFQIYFNALVGLFSNTAQPTTLDLQTAKSYFDQCDAFWGPVSSPGSWTKSLAIPGYGTGDELRNAYYSTMATLYSAYGNNRLNDIENQKTIDDFQAVMQTNITIITDVQTAFNNASSLYGILATDYQTVEFSSLYNAYKSLADNFEVGITAYNSKNYQAAATSFASALTDSKPLLSTMFTSQDRKQAGDSALMAARTPLQGFVASDAQKFLDEVTLMQSGTTTAELSFMDNLKSVSDAAGAQYQTALTAYNDARAITDVPALQSYFDPLIANLNVAVQALSSLSSSANFISNADKVGALISSVAGIDSAAASYDQGVALAKTVDTMIVTSPGVADYLQIYTVLGSNWSFQNFYKQHAALVFYQDAINLSPETDDSAWLALKYALFLKAYAYKDVLSSDIVTAIEKELQESDLLSTAASFKSQADGLKVQDWEPQAGIDHYNSSAVQIWNNVLNAYRAAYALNVGSQNSLFIGASSLYVAACKDYAQAYLENVQDQYYPQLGAAFIYYEAYLVALQVGDTVNAASYEATIVSLMKDFFDTLSKLRGNVTNQRFEYAFYYYGRLKQLLAVVSSLISEQDLVVSTLSVISPLASGYKKVLSVSGTADSLGYGTDFGGQSVVVGVLDLVFAQHCNDLGVAAQTSADNSLNTLGSSFTQDQALIIQALYSTASSAFAQAAQLYTILGQSDKASQMTSLSTTIISKLYGISYLATVLPEQLKTYAKRQVAGLFMLSPTYWLIPSEILNVIPLANYVKTYSLSTEDQQKLLGYAAWYQLSESEWTAFTTVMNQLQYPVSFPLNQDAWQNLKNILGTYLSSDEQSDLASMITRYTMPQSAQASLTSYLFYLPALLYLYQDLKASGKSLSLYGTTYDKVAQFMSSLVPASTTSLPWNTVFPDETGLKSNSQLALNGYDIATARQYLIDAFSYLEKIAALTTTGIKGVRGTLLIAQSGSSYYLVENNKPTLALPTASLAWFPTPSTYYTLASKKITLSTLISQLIADTWLSAAYQTELKLNYAQGLAADEELVSVLCFSDEFDYLTQLKQTLALLKPLQSSVPSALAITDTTQYTNPLAVVAYYYNSFMTAISGAGFDQQTSQSILGKVSQEYGAYLAQFLVGNPSSSYFTNLLKNCSAQYIAALGFYADDVSKESVVAGLGSIFARAGLLASSNRLVMDMTQKIPQLFSATGFELYDYQDAASYYANSVTVLGLAALTTDAVILKQQMQLNVLRSYYQVMVQNFCGYLILCQGQGTSFNTIAQAYAQWIAQQQSIERVAVDITQDEIDVFQSINNAILDALIYGVTAQTVGATYVTMPAQTDPAAQALNTVITDYLNSMGVLSQLTADAQTFVSSSWQEIQNSLMAAFDHFGTNTLVASDFTTTMQNINTLLGVLYSALQQRYMIDWEGSLTDAAAATSALNDLINAMSARQSATMTVNYVS